MSQFRYMDKMRGLAPLNGRVEIYFDSFHGRWMVRVRYEQFGQEFGYEVYLDVFASIDDAFLHAVEHLEESAQ